MKKTTLVRVLVPEWAVFKATSPQGAVSVFSAKPSPIRNQWRFPNRTAGASIIIAYTTRPKDWTKTLHKI